MEENNIIDINFGKKRFDAIICLNANLPGRQFFEMMELPVLAADGASIRLLNINIKADYIVGDLDSFDSEKYSNEFVDSEIIFDPSQDSNDFEKVLKFAAGKGFQTLLITGFHGGQLEHTFNNWSVLMRYSKILNICIFDENRYGICFIDSFRLNTKIDELISLIPQPKVKIKTKNLKWELNDEFLELGVREGARNRAVAEHIEIKIGEGSLVAFFDARLPYAPKMSEP